jgi:hypothetical protein
VRLQDVRKGQARSTEGSRGSSAASGVVSQVAMKSTTSRWRRLARRVDAFRSPLDHAMLAAILARSASSSPMRASRVELHPEESSAARFPGVCHLRRPRPASLAS